MPGPDESGSLALADYPRWRDEHPRVLTFAADYFLCFEIRQALKRLGYPARHLALPKGDLGDSGFIERLLRAVLEFKPDFALAVNHLGLDRSGALMGLLAKLKLPLASWFVDDPLLILHDEPELISPWCLPFSFDRDKLPGLIGLGFPEAEHLALATDPERFSPKAEPIVNCQVSFVGDSMRGPVRDLAGKLASLPELGRSYRELGQSFAQSGQRDVARFINELRPDLTTELESLDKESRLNFERLVTFEATRIYRESCLRETMEFSPLLAGDEAWQQVLPGAGKTWFYHKRLDYYRELPGFYRGSGINFNTTSLQMKGAPNQRVFDAPACGAFVLTDWREQLAELFEPGKELISYAEPGEIRELIRHYQRHKPKAREIAARARQRILSEHTYVQRVKELCGKMRRRYSKA